MRVELDSLHAAPWGQPLLADIDFSLEHGQVLGILGPNGAGKTSLLNLLCGAVQPSQGTLRLNNRPLSEWSLARRARSIAVLPQQSNLSFPYTVREVVALGRTPHASGAAADAQVVDEVLEATDTSHLRHRLYTQLSGGEKQRVQLARVFAQVWREQDADGRLLLLDEPTSALDLSHQQLVMETVQQMAAGGCTAVVIAHDFNLAARYTQRCLVLDQGVQRACGSPVEVLCPTLFRDVFGVEAEVMAHPADGRPVVVLA
jgi:iron complex transport system ATP-binding protein